MPSRFPNMFFTADIAALLEIAEWRVIKFAQGTEYQIAPSHSDASGSGTRRVYDIEDVCQIALALRLLDAGLSSKTIGTILQQLKSKESERLSAKLEQSDPQLRDLYLAVFRSPKRRYRYFSATRSREVFFVSGFQEALVEQGERREDDLLLVSVGATFRQLIRRLKKFQKQKAKEK
jgi:DNA-binding transcriptional MerR regulator